MPKPLYSISASLPAGTPYTDKYDKALTRAGMEPGASAYLAYSDQDRDERVTAITAAGLIPHIRPA